MVERSLAERFCIYWWTDENEDWIQQLACALQWPVPIETDVTEVLDAGGV